MITQQITVDTRADAVHHAIADETGNCESHEEMLECHELLQIDGEGHEEDAVTEVEDERREVHPYLIYQQKSETNSKQPRVGLAQHFHPPQTEETSRYHTHDTDQIQS